MTPLERPRAPDEIDLVAIVRRILIDHVGTERVMLYYDTSRFIEYARDRNSEVQRTLLNRYWNYQIMTVNIESQEERFCLIPNGQIDEWLRLWQSKVLPFVIQHQLPVA